MANDTKFELPDGDDHLPIGFKMLCLAEAEAFKRGTRVAKIDKTEAGFRYTLADDDRG